MQLVISELPPDFPGEGGYMHDHGRAYRVVRVPCRGLGANPSTQGPVQQLPLSVGSVVTVEECSWLDFPEDIAMARGCGQPSRRPPPRR